MYFKISRQFTKETQSQFHQSHQKLIFLSKFCIGMSGLTFADGSCSALSVSPCVIGSSTTLQFLRTQAFRHEIFQLSQCQYTCVRDHLHIESSHSFNKNDAKFQTPPHISFTQKCQICQKINVYNFRYKKVQEFQ